MVRRGTAPRVEGALWPAACLPASQLGVVPLGVAPAVPRAQLRVELLVGEQLAGVKVGRQMQPLRPVLPLREHELVHDPRLAPGTRHLQCRDPSSVLQVFRGPSADQLSKARYLALSGCNVEDTSTPRGLELRVSSYEWRDMERNRRKEREKDSDV